MKLRSSVIVAPNAAIAAMNGDNDVAPGRVGRVTLVSNMGSQGASRNLARKSGNPLVGAIDDPAALMADAPYDATLKIPILGMLKGGAPSASGILLDDHYSVQFPCFDAALSSRCAARVVYGVFDGFDQLLFVNESGVSLESEIVSAGPYSIQVPCLPAGATWTVCIPSGIVGLADFEADGLSSGSFAIEPEWIADNPQFEASEFIRRFGSVISEALHKPTGKRDGAGNAMQVWQDFVAGTDPTDESDVFTASITFDSDGKPVISYSPEFADAAEAAKRTYTTYGKVKLNDAKWVEVTDGEEANYNFFKVTVEMK